MQDLYGIGEKETDDFGRQLLLARRLAERGVRFIQVCHAGGGNGGWDAHGDIKTHAPLCRATDKPIAGLIRDLKQRGMLDETLVVWTSEFGRSPWSQNTTGRDHNPRGYTAWLAGGGVKGGVVHGATDDVGYKAVETPALLQRPARHDPAAARPRPQEDGSPGPRPDHAPGRRGRADQGDHRLSPGHTLRLQVRKRPRRQMTGRPDPAPGRSRYEILSPRHPPPFKRASYLSP